VGLKWKAGTFPVSLDRGAHFSCIRSDNLRYLQQRCEDVTLLPSSPTCLLAGRKRVQVEIAVRLRFSLLGFSWDYEFKVLDEGHSPAFLVLDFLRHTRMG